MARTNVFVSYSHDDTDWLKRFLVHTAVLERRGLVDVWSDTRLAVGTEWQKEIDSALTAAKVSVLLVSPAFLASRFIWDHEMPLIVAHAAQGMSVLPLITRPCAWRLEEELARLQARPTDGRPLSLGSESQVDSDLSAFAYELAALVGRSPVAVTVPSTDAPSLTSEASGVAGEWSGYYNRTRPVRLLIQELDDDTIRGTMEYPAEGTVTQVQGSVHSGWSPDDPVWAQIIGGMTYQGKGVAVSFRETSYERRGSSSISFDGDYRAFVNGNEMTGAWFSGQRLVGSLSLQRIVSNNHGQPGASSGRLTPHA